jgi:hypothetical protein
MPKAKSIMLHALNTMSFISPFAFILDAFTVAFCLEL